MARTATHSTCESLHRLDVGALNRSGLLSGSGTITLGNGPCVTVNGYGDILKLTFGADDEAVVQRISIDKTPVHLGGHRAWFLCPGCDRRISALYFVRHFQCRHCHDLRYASQRDTPRFRAISRIQRARKKLGGSENLLQPRPSRPRYMHAQTYQRLLREEEAAWNAYSAT